MLGALERGRGGGKHSFTSLACGLPIVVLLLLLQLHHRFVGGGECGGAGLEVVVLCEDGREGVCGEGGECCGDGESVLLGMDEKEIGNEGS